MDWIVRVSNPVRGSTFFSFSNVHTCCGANRNSNSWAGVFCPGGKAVGALSYSPGFSVKVKSEWSYTSLSLVCFYGVNSEHCVFHMDFIWRWLYAL
jgi:hypothetical protein